MRGAWWLWIAAGVTLEAVGLVAHARGGSGATLSALVDDLASRSPVIVLASVGLFLGWLLAHWLAPGAVWPAAGAVGGLLAGLAAGKARRDQR